MREETKCKLCNDTGWVITDKGALKCECQIVYKKDNIVKALNIPRRYSHASLDNFKAMKNYGHHILIERLKEYIYSDEYQEGKGFFFYGKHGVGKTHLAVSILRELYIKQRITGLFYDTKMLLYDLKATFDGSSSTRELLDSVISAKILILDDLGTERLSDWAKDILHYVIVKRYNDKLPIIITTNFDLERDNNIELTIRERFGEGIVSRIKEMCYIINVEGNDYRGATFNKVKV
ncbi:MAG: ATP-binding protein [Hydrogenothermaceae bacterium]